jgi:hypothetical protein
MRRGGTPQRHPVFAQSPRKDLYRSFILRQLRWRILPREGKDWTEMCLSLFLTRDEESSGITHASTILPPGKKFRISWSSNKGERPTLSMKAGLFYFYFNGMAPMYRRDPDGQARPKMRCSRYARLSYQAYGIPVLCLLLRPQVLRPHHYYRQYLL